MTKAIVTESPKKPEPRRTLRERLTRNPVVLKELRGRMRGSRAFVVLTVYLLLMSGFASLLYFAYAASTRTGFGIGSGGGVLGKVVFGGVVGIELFLVCFIAPAFTAGAISSERERQTYDLLRTTLLPARSLVMGKLISALSYVFLLLLAALPLQSLAFLLGGVELAEVLIATAVLVATALGFGSVGIFFSSLVRRTLAASVLTYAFALLATVGLPLLLFVFAPIVDIIFSRTASVLAQALLVYAFGLLISVNPLATVIATEIILIEEQTAFYFTTTLRYPASLGSSSMTLPLVSPWIVYVLLYLLLSVVLVWISVRLVKRAEK